MGGPARAARFVALAAAVAGATACGDGPAAPSVADDVVEGSFGLVALEREGGDAPGDVRLTAAFARHWAIDAAAVTELLTGRPTLSEGACALVDGALEDALGSAAAEVALLEAGPLRVELGGDVAEVRSRAFPELGGSAGGLFVSGWYYGESMAPGPGPLAPGAAAAGVPAAASAGAVAAGGAGGAAADAGRVALRSAGSVEVEAFSVRAAWPPAPASGRYGDPAPRRVDGVDVTWERPAGDAAPTRVEIEVHSGGRQVLCAAADDGAFHVPGAVLRWLDADAMGRLVVRRARSLPFEAPGLDQAHAVLSVVESHPLVLR